MTDVSERHLIILVSQSYWFVRATINWVRALILRKISGLLCRLVTGTTSQTVRGALFPGFRAPHSTKAIYHL